ncbi:MAG: AI-2E family transporter [Planctomycetes bacterium]|nr:AI-2E family transporter [Planctomycetota bacterium]
MPMNDLFSPTPAPGALPEVVSPRPAKGHNSTSIRGIFLLMLLAVMYIGKALLVPVVAAILLSFLLAPAVRWLSFLRIPRALCAMLILILTIGTLAGGIYLLAAPAQVWMQRLPDDLRHLEERFRSLRKPVDQVNAAAHQMEAMTTNHESGKQVVTLSAPSTFASHVMTTGGELLAGLAIVVITLFFLLASGNSILGRLVRMVPSLRADIDPSKLLMGSPHDGDSMMVIQDTERRVGLFLAITTLINASLAAVLTLAFWMVGLPNPLLWGVLAGALNFLPYIGPLIGIPLVAIVSLASFPSLGMALAPPLIYASIAFIEGNFITPYVMGKRLAMSPIAIFVWMAFWGWMWGAAGALIAVPMLVMVKEFCSRIDSLKSIATVIEP